MLLTYGSPPNFTNPMCELLSMDDASLSHTRPSYFAVYSIEKLGINGPGDEIMPYLQCVHYMGTFVYIFDYNIIRKSRQKWEGEQNISGPSFRSQWLDVSNMLVLTFAILLLKPPTYLKFLP